MVFFDFFGGFVNNGLTEIGDVLVVRIVIDDIIVDEVMGEILESLVDFVADGSGVRLANIV